LFQAAAARLVSQSSGDVVTAARRLVTAAPAHGIDLSLVFATVDRDATGRATRVRQACLAVPGAGRTVMMFTTEPPRGGDPGGPLIGKRERTACIDEAFQHIRSAPNLQVEIAQGLPEPREFWAIEAFAAAGFTTVGNLVYMRRSLADRPKSSPAEILAWPPAMPGLEVKRFDQLPLPQRDAMLVEALDRSYENTLDCPELCGLRKTRDVLDSHRATGVFDPALWTVILVDCKPLGCMLLNRCPEQRVIELVYLGVSGALRGKGVARALLSNGLSRLRAAHPAWSLACAVDARNEPALRLYRSIGMRAFGERVAVVRPVHHDPSR
jgi:ribosomal protein S18 acetylase RimI-like enzyme